MGHPRTARRHVTLQALAALLDRPLTDSSLGSLEIHEMPSARELFERYRAGVYNACKVALVEAADAEDACQEVFRRLFVRLASPRGKPSTPVQALLHQMTYQCIVDVIRRRRRVAANYVSDPKTADLVPDNGAGVEILVEQLECSQLLQQLKDELTPTQRRVLEARLFFGHLCETKEVASDLRMNPSTYRRHLQDIRQRAEKFFRKQNGVSDDER